MLEVQRLNTVIDKQSEKTTIRTIYVVEFNMLKNEQCSSLDIAY